MTTDTTLRVSFVFPGHPTVIEIHVNREIGTGSSSKNMHEYVCDPMVELALNSVPALRMTSVFSRAGKNTYTTEFSMGFYRDDVCLDIAIALAGAYDADDVVIGEIIDNRMSRIAFC